MSSSESQNCKEVVRITIRMKIQTTLRTLHIRKLSTNNGVHNNVPSEELRTIE